MARIVKYSHHFTVDQYDGDMWREIARFIVTFQQYSTRYQKGIGLIKNKTKLFAEGNASRTLVRMHINVFDDFLKHMELRGYKPYNFRYVDKPMYKPATCKPEMPDFMKPRDYQVPQIDYLCDGKSPIKILTLQTGKGKTYCALEAVRRLGLRTLISVPAKYLGKWKKDVIEAYGDSVEIFVVQGGASLRNLLALAKAGELTADVIVCSSNTIANYFKEYKYGTVFTYEVEPPDMFEALEVGVRLIDEVHEGIHFNYRFDCFTHVPLTISLSATIVSRDELINRVVDYMFPVELRAPEMKYDKYVDVVGLGYKVALPNTVRCKNAGMYSHNTYEQWVMSKKKRREAYRDFIFDLMHRIYYSKGNFKQKILIFAASIEMCKYLAEEYAKLYPDLNVTTKVQDDDFEVLEENNVIFSTLLSTGTAVDIDDLAYVLMTTSIDSDSANLQAIGRLRRLKNYPDQTPEFYYLACTDVEKQMLYHRNKQKLFLNRAKHHRWYMTDVVIP